VPLGDGPPPPAPEGTGPPDVTVVDAHTGASHVRRGWGRAPADARGPSSGALPAAPAPAGLPSWAGSVGSSAGGEWYGGRGSLDAARVGPGWAGLREWSDDDDDRCSLDPDSHALTPQQIAGLESWIATGEGADADPLVCALAAQQYAEDLDDAWYLSPAGPGRHLHSHEPPASAFQSAQEAWRTESGREDPAGARGSPARAPERDGRRGLMAARGVCRRWRDVADDVAGRWGCFASGMRHAGAPDAGAPDAGAPGTSHKSASSWATQRHRRATDSSGAPTVGEDGAGPSPREPPPAWRVWEARGRGLHHLAATGGAGAMRACAAGEDVDAEDASPARLTPLLVAVGAGDVACVAALLGLGADPNKPTSLAASARSPLAVAAGSGHAGVVRSLVRAGARVDVPDADGATPLHAACAGGRGAAVALLLGEGAAGDVADRSGATPLLRAAEGGHDGVVRSLLDRGAPRLDATDETGLTPLVAAAAGGHLGAVEALVAAGARVDGRGGRETALMAAARGGHEGTVRALLGAGASPACADPDGRTALALAAAAGHLGTVAALVGAGAAVDRDDREGNTPLMAAAAAGHAAVVAELAGAGADPNWVNVSWTGPLLLAASGGHAGAVAALLAAGAEVDVNPLACSCSPLLAAAEQGHAEVADLLIAAGASVDAEDLNGYTPLMAAAAHGHGAVFKALLGAGAAVGRQCDTGCTALTLAAGEGHEEVVRALIDAGAPVDLPSTVEQATPLLSAAFFGHASIARELLRSGADVNWADAKGFTALAKAAARGHVEVCRLLLAAGADVDRRDFLSGSTPLILAAERGHLGAVEALIEAGADPHVKSAFNKTALEYVRSSEARGGSRDRERLVTLLRGDVVVSPP